MKKPWEYQWDNLSDRDIEEIILYAKSIQRNRDYNSKLVRSFNRIYDAKNKAGVDNVIYYCILEFCDELNKRQSMREYQEKMQKSEVKPAMKNIDMEELKYLKFERKWSNKSLAERYGVTERTIRNRLKQIDEAGGKK